jgi:hypothetical protein
MKLLVMQFSTTSYHLIPLRSQIFSSAPYFKHHHKQNYSSVYSNFYVFRQQTESKNSELNGRKLCPYLMFFISSWIKFWFVTVAPKYFNLRATLLSNLIKRSTDYLPPVSSPNISGQMLEWRNENGTSSYCLAWEKIRVDEEKRLYRKLALLNPSLPRSWISNHISVSCEVFCSVN